MFFLLNVNRDAYRQSLFDPAHMQKGAALSLPAKSRQGRINATDCKKQHSTF